MPRTKPSVPRERTVRAGRRLAVRKAELLLTVVMTPFGIAPVRRSIGLRARSGRSIECERRTR